MLCICPLLLLLLLILLLFIWLIQKWNEFWSAVIAAAEAEAISVSSERDLIAEGKRKERERKNAAAAAECWATLIGASVSAFRMFHVADNLQSEALVEGRVVVQRKDETCAAAVLWPQIRRRSKNPPRY